MARVKTDSVVKAEKPKRAPRKKKVAEEVVETVPTPIPSGMVDSVEPIDLEEFTDAMETASLPSMPPTTITSMDSKLANIFSYYDVEKRSLANIDCSKYDTDTHKVVFAYLSTEKNKQRFCELIVESWSDCKIETLSTNHTSIKAHMLLAPVSFANQKLLDVLVNVFAAWQDAKYYHVTTVDAFSKYMTEELESIKTHPHKCMLLKTCKFYGPDGNLVASGMPIIWDFMTSYMDPNTKSTNFLYQINPAYHSGIDGHVGLVDEQKRVFHKYNITISDIAELLSTNADSMVFLFQSDELHSFVKKETNVLFSEINLKVFR